MKDFQLRNDTKLLFRNEPLADLTKLVKEKNVLFVYGEGSIKKSGCYDDVKQAVIDGKGQLVELGGASRELSDIERGIRLAKEKGITLVVGAGGAQVMDCAKLIAFGFFHEADIWEYVKGRKNPYGLGRLPLVLMPTYPSSGSEYGLGAVAQDARTGDFGTAYGIAADTAILVPKYSLSLNEEMTAYASLVTLVQLSAATLGDKNKVSYGVGVSVMRSVLDAARMLKKNPRDMDARGAILYGAALSTSSRLGLGKEDNYAYDIYEVEFIPEALFGAPYRKSLTTLFPRFLKAMAKYHEEDVRLYFADVYGFTESAASSAERLVALFEDFGVAMHFEGNLSEKECAAVKTSSVLKGDEIFAIMKECMKQ